MAKNLNTALEYYVEYIKRTYVIVSPSKPTIRLIILLLRYGDLK